MTTTHACLRLSIHDLPWRCMHVRQIHEPSKKQNRFGIESEKDKRVKGRCADVQMWMEMKRVGGEETSKRAVFNQRKKPKPPTWQGATATHTPTPCLWVSLRSEQEMRKWKTSHEREKKTHVQSEASFVLKEVLFWRFMPICEHPWAINKLEKKRRNEKRTSDKARSRACVCNNCRSRKKPVRKKITPLTAKLVETYRRKDEYLHTKDCKGLKGNFPQLLGFHQSQKVSGADR